MMKRTIFKAENAFAAGKLQMITYETLKFCTSWLVVLPGRGETGPVDGSEILEVENPITYAKHAKNGYDFPFNIVAAQCVGDYTQELNWLIHWLRSHRDADKIGMSGLSLGGQWCYNAAIYDNLQEKIIIKGVERYAIDFIVPVSAVNPDPKLYPATKLMNIPVYSMHGTADITNSFAQEETFYKAVLADPNRTAEFSWNPIQGGGHDSWNKAFALDPNNSCWKFIHKYLKEDLVVDRYDEGYEKGKEDGTQVGVVAGQESIKNQLVSFINSI